MSTSMQKEEISDLAESTGLSEKEIMEIIELVGPNRSSVIREATILKRSLENSRNTTKGKTR